MATWKARGTNLDLGHHNYGCLRKFNYSNGAGWRTKAETKKGKKKLSWGIKSKR